MTERIQEAIDIFLDAINNGTLAKGDCKACAVGNLVAYGKGATLENKKGTISCDMNNYAWMHLFTTGEGCQEIDLEKLSWESVQECISSTSFTWKELAKIEYEFETSTRINYFNYPKYSKQEIREDQIRGLEAVVTVMLEFDEVEVNVKEVFTNKANAIPLTV